MAFEVADWLDLSGQFHGTPDDVSDELILVLIWSDVDPLCWAENSPQAVSAGEIPLVFRHAAAGDDPALRGSGSQVSLTIRHIHITIASFGLFPAPSIIERSERPEAVMPANKRKRAFIRG